MISSQMELRAFNACFSYSLKADMNLSTLLGSNASSDGMSSDTRLRISFPSGVVIFAMNSNFAVFIDLDVLITILENVKNWQIFYEMRIFNRTGRNVLSQYFAKKVDEGIDELCDNGSITLDTIESWGNEHLRTSCK